MLEKYFIKILEIFLQHLRSFWTHKNRWRW